MEKRSGGAQGFLGFCMATTNQDNAINFRLQTGRLWACRRLFYGATICSILPPPPPRDFGAIGADETADFTTIVNEIN